MEAKLHLSGCVAVLLGLDLIWQGLSGFLLVFVVSFLLNRLEVEGSVVKGDCL